KDIDKRLKNHENVKKQFVENLNLRFKKIKSNVDDLNHRAKDVEFLEIASSQETHELLNDLKANNDNSRKLLDELSTDASNYGVEIEDLETVSDSIAFVEHFCANFEDKCQKLHRSPIDSPEFIERSADNEPSFVSNLRMDLDELHGSSDKDSELESPAIVRPEHIDMDVHFRLPSDSAEVQSQFVVVESKLPDEREIEIQGLQQFEDQLQSFIAKSTDFDSQIRRTLSIQDLDSRLAALRELLDQVDDQDKKYDVFWLSIPEKFKFQFPNVEERMKNEIDKIKREIDQLETYLLAKERESTVLLKESEDLHESILKIDNSCSDKALEKMNLDERIAALMDCERKLQNLYEKTHSLHEKSTKSKIDSPDLSHVLQTIVNNIGNRLKFFSDQKLAVDQLNNRLLLLKSFSHQLLSNTDENFINGVNDQEHFILDLRLKNQDMKNAVKEIIAEFSSQRLQPDDNHSDLIQGIGVEIAIVDEFCHKWSNILSKQKMKRDISLNIGLVRPEKRNVYAEDTLITPETNVKVSFDTCIKSPLTQNKSPVDTLIPENEVPFK
uniref:Uncharacterized protein n=1 Tax=Romanomermis culicivorax TaxID=13658 RepID=A0A915IF71_ROMCU